MNLVNLMKLHTLKMFNTGQVTLPKKWRERFATELFFAEETEEGLLIRPLLTGEESSFLENETHIGVCFPKGIDPAVLMKQLSTPDGSNC